MESAKKPIVVEHCASPEKPGGPVVEMRRLMESRLLCDNYDMRIVAQTRPAGGFNPALICEMARNMRRTSADLVHVRGLQNEGFHGVLAARAAGCRRIIVSVHGFGADDLRVGLAKRLLFNRFIEPFTLWNATALICVCQHQINRPMLRRWGRGKTHLIYNPAPFFLPTVSRDRMRSELGFTASDTVCVTVSRITRDKGFEALVRAIRMGAGENYKGIKHLIVGDGDYAQSVRNCLRAEISEGTVVMTGSRSDVTNLLSASDLFVFPSLHENLPLCLLEASVAGLGVIATRVGGIPEIIIHNQTGVLLPANNPNALHSAVLELAHDNARRTRLGLASRQRVKTIFSPEKIYRQVAHLYRHLLST